MFDDVIKNQIQNYLRQLKFARINFANVIFRNEAVILLTNIPSNFRAQFHSHLSDLESFGLKWTEIRYKGTPAVIISNLPAQFKKIIQDAVSEIK